MRLHENAELRCGLTSLAARDGWPSAGAATASGRKRPRHWPVINCSDPHGPDRPESHQDQHPNPIGDPGLDVKRRAQGRHAEPGTQGGQVLAVRRPA